MGSYPGWLCELRTFFFVVDKMAVGGESAFFCSTRFLGPSLKFNREAPPGRVIDGSGSGRGAVQSALGRSRQASDPDRHLPSRSALPPDGSDSPAWIDPVARTRPPWGPCQVMQAMAKCIHVGYDSSTMLLNVVPLFHVGGLSSTLAVTMNGGCHVFLPRFQARAGAAAVPAAAVNTLVVVPTMLHMMLAASDGSDEHPLAGVETVLVGGDALSPELAARARSLMPRATIIQTYACSEAGSSITFAHEREGGRAAVNVELRVVECGQREGSPVRLAPSGTVGEVETRGPHVMKCYWGRPGLTREALRADGWLRTGDLGRLDELSGRLLVVGRSKDVIKTGGEKVNATVVEEVLLRHSWVAQAAVYGEKDERLGEQVVAGVVLDSAEAGSGGASHEEAEAVLRSFCAQHLGLYERPKRFEFVTSLPRNSAGKVKRHNLRSSL